MTCSRPLAFLCLTSVSFLAGCRFDAPSTGPDAASFALDMVRLAADMQTAPASEDWPFLRRKTFDVKICFRDAATLSPIVGESFSLVQADGAQTRLTDGAGCAAFNQGLQYNELAPEAYVASEGYVRGDGAYKGGRRVKVAVNPWTESLLDLAYSPGHGVVPTSRGADALFGREEFGPAEIFRNRTEPPFSNLVVSDRAQIQRVEIKSVREHVFRIDLPLAYRRKRLNGAFEARPLEFGKFRLEATLFEERPEAGGSFKRFVAGRMAPREVSASEGKILVERAVVALQHALHPQATYEWLVKLAPVSPIGGLLGYEGSLVIPFDQLEGPVAAVPGEQAPGALERRLAASEAALPVGASEVLVLGREYQPELIGYSIDIRDVTHSQERALSKVNYSGNEESEARAQLKVCLKDTVNGSAISRASFEASLVRKGRGALEPPRGAASYETQADGCFLFTAPVRFNWVGAEQYLPYFLVLRSKSPRYRQEPVAVSIALNPWLHDKEAFFWNTSQLGSPPENPDGRPASLEIASAKYEYPFSHYDFELNRDTSLTRKEIFLFTLVPTLRRHFTFARRDPAERSESIAAGTKLRLKAAFVKLASPSSDAAVREPGKILDESLISAFESEVTVQATARPEEGNVIVAPIVLAHDFHERMLFEGFTHVYLELGASGATGPSAPRSATFFGLFQPLGSTTPGGTSVSLRRTETDIAMVWEKLAARRGFVARETRVKDGYAEDERIRLLSYKLLKPVEKTAFDPLKGLLGSIQGGRETTVTHLPADGTDPEWPASFPATLKDRRLFVHFLRNRDDFLSPRTTDATVRATLEVFAKSRLCPLYAPEDSACAANPFDYVTVHLLELLDTESSEARFPVQGEYKGSDNNALEVRMRVFKEAIETLRTYGGTNVSDGPDSGRQERVGFDKFGNGFSRYSGYVYSDRKFFATEIAQTRDIRQRDEVLFLKRLNYYQTVLQFRMPVRTCLMLGPGPKHRDFDAGKGKHLVCDSRVKTVGDSWYYVVGDLRPEAAGVSEVRDPEGRYLKLIRGSYLFDDFKRALTDMAHAIHLELVPSFRMGPTEMLRLSYNDTWRGFGIHGDGGAYPGVLRVRRMPPPNGK